jgi:hypothetical protein
MKGEGNQEPAQPRRPTGTELKAQLSEAMEKAREGIKQDYEERLRLKAAMAAEEAASKRPSTDSSPRETPSSSITGGKES